MPTLKELIDEETRGRSRYAPPGPPSPDRASQPPASSSAGFYSWLSVYLIAAFSVGMLVAGQNLSGLYTGIYPADVTHATVGPRLPVDYQTDVRAPERIDVSGARDEEELVLRQYENTGRKAWDASIYPAYEIYQTAAEAFASPANNADPFVSGIGQFINSSGEFMDEVPPGHVADARYRIHIVDQGGKRLDPGTYFIRWFLEAPSPIAFRYGSATGLDASPTITRLVVDSVRYQ